MVGQVDMLGAINTVVLEIPGIAAKLRWTDGEWNLDHGSTTIPAPGVPKAASMKEAARVGRAWITENSEDQDARSG